MEKLHGIGKTLRTQSALSPVRCVKSCAATHHRALHLLVYMQLVSFWVSEILALLIFMVSTRCKNVGTVPRRCRSVTTENSQLLICDQEAVRVSTPPLDEDTADGKARGFFTSTTPPELSNTDGTTISARSHRPARRQNVHRSSMSGHSREWWEHSPRFYSRRENIKRNGSFYFSIPEHLPTSPLCPANTKHKSGGTGLCVYHGRRRLESTLRDEFYSLDQKGSRGSY